MEFAVYEGQWRTITELFKGMSNRIKSDMLDFWHDDLVRNYGFDIDELEDMVFGRRPDITKPCWS